MSNKSSIRDNRERGTVGNFLQKSLESNAKLSVVSAYFTIYAYDRLKDKLDGLEKVRFLFGEPRFIKSLDPEKTDKKAFNIEDDNQTINLDNRLEQKRVAKACADWIREKVEIKSLVKPNFLHGKMYHIERQKEDAAILGSSNFTVNGLGLGSHPNIELNQVLNDRRDIDDLKDWFDDFWKEDGRYNDVVEDVKAEVLEYLEQLYADNSPEFVYYKTLFHLFEQYLQEQSDNNSINAKTGFYESKIWNLLYDFQKDAVRSAVNKIQKHNGCIIADSVGLGKTFEALAVIKYFESLNYRVLVICPKKLRENWVKYTLPSKLNNLIEDRFNFNTLSHTDLTRKTGMTGDINLATLYWANYDLIVIDESHNFRNNARGKENDKGEYRQSGYEFLMDEVIKKGINTKVLLLSATPVNNNLKDLRNQIYLITAERKNALKEEGVKDIEQVMRIAQTHFSNWANPKKNPNRDIAELLERLDAGFFKLLDELTIARSRNHIRKYYDMAKIGKFPTRQKVKSIYPNIDLEDMFPSYDKIYKDISAYRLALYNPTSYVLPEFQGHYETKAGKEIKAFSQQTRESYLIGMMRVNFLKRLESSIESFEISIKRTIDKITALQERIELFEKALEKGQLLEDGTINENYTQPEDDEDDEDLTNALLNTDLAVGKKLKFELQHLDLEMWKKDLKEDKDQLKSIYASAKMVTPEQDAKLAELKKLILNKINKPLNEGNKKVIVFTAFADTAEYLYLCLEKWATDNLKLHIAMVAGGTKENKTTFKLNGYQKQTEFNAILTNFAPIAKERDRVDSMPQIGEIDILIATDCISEGQNLQDCDYLINYDIHWNPVRIIQRFGRIDRIGSTNDKIQLVNFWPTKDLNQYINLKDRVESRMALVDLTATGEENLLNTEEIQNLVEEDMKYRDKQLLRMQDEILDMEDLKDNISLSEFTLDDFRIELMNFLEDNKRKLQDAPLGLYAVVPAPQGEFKHLTTYENLSFDAQKLIKPGVIFCLKFIGKTSDESKDVNPLQPFFLVYIREDKTVRYSFSAAKQILDIYRVLCQNKILPYEEICRLFDKETNQGLDTDKYSVLLKTAIKDINKSFGKRTRMKLNQRGGVIPKKEEQITEAATFELITWLVIK
jgi:SNF2 family DNA or RNA helicase